MYESSRSQFFKTSKLDLGSYIISIAKCASKKLES